MALIPSPPLPVRFSGGIETKLDAKAVPSVRLLKCQNALFTKLVSLVKRNGYEALGRDVLGEVEPYRDPRGLAVRGDSELLLFTESGPLSYIEGVDAWSRIADGAVSVRQADRPLAKTASGQTTGDRAVCDGVALVAWEDTRGGVWFSVTEEDDGRVIIAPTQASATGTRPRCVRAGANLVLLWGEVALGQIKSIAVPSPAPHTYSSAQVVTDDLGVDSLGDPLPAFDAVPADAGAMFVWNASAAVTLAWLTPAGQLGTLALGWPDRFQVAHLGKLAAGPALSVAYDADADAWAAAIAWATTARCYAATATSPAPPSTAAMTGTAAIEVIATDGADQVAACLRNYSGGAGTVDLWYETREAVALDSYVVRRQLDVATSAVSTPTPGVFRGAMLGTAAWCDGPSATEQRGYVTLFHPAPLFAVYLAVRDDGLLVAVSLPSNAGSGSPPGYQLPRVADEDGDRVFEWVGVYRNRLIADAEVAAATDDVFSDPGLRLVSYDFGADDAYQTATFGRTLYLGGAVTYAYDGVGFVEAGFPYAPDWTAGTALHGDDTGGDIQPGTRSYVFWYEAPLANGEVIRGPVSRSYVVETVDPDREVEFEIPTLRIGAWGREGGARENARICVARTIDGNSSVYYRVTSSDPSTVGDVNGYLENDQGADSVKFTDALSDDDLLKREPLYTNDGIPSNDPIGTSGIIAAGKGRLFFGDSSDPRAVYFSQERAEGYALECTPELRLVSPGSGQITAVGVIDDLVVLYERNAIYVTHGPGPLPAPAAGGGFASPRPVPTDMGCISQRSIVNTPHGQLFQSAQGIRLLDRGGGVHYIGSPVEAYNSQRIVRATQIDGVTQVRFLTDDGETLHFDTEHGQWSTFTNHQGLDAATVNGVYHYLRTDGRVFRETAGEYADENASIRVVIETAKLKFREAIQGFQRLWHAQIIGTWRSAHTLRVQIQTELDPEGSWSEPYEFDATGMGGTVYGEGQVGDGEWGGTSPDPYEWLIHVGLSCEWVAFRFTFVEAHGQYGACAELTELLLTGGVKGARNQLPASRMG